MGHEQEPQKCKVAFSEKANLLNDDFHISSWGPNQGTMHVNIDPVTRLQELQWQQPASKGSKALDKMETNVEALHRHCAVS